MFFEVVIRYLGGLLSAYALSERPPEPANRREQGRGYGTRTRDQVVAARNERTSNPHLSFHHTYDNVRPAKRSSNAPPASHLRSWTSTDTSGREAT